MNSQANSEKNNSEVSRGENLHEAVWLRSKKRSAKMRAAVLGVLGVAIACAVLTGNAHESPVVMGGQAASVGQ